MTKTYFMRAELTFKDGKIIHGCIGRHYTTSHEGKTNFELLHCTTFFNSFDKVMEEYTRLCMKKNVKQERHEHNGFVEYEVHCYKTVWEE